MRAGVASLQRDLILGADPVYLPALMSQLFDTGSTSEGRRLIGQGGVRINGEVVHDLEVPRERLSGAVLQVGKRQYVRFPAV